jgi:hypothetical protein
MNHSYCKVNYMFALIDLILYIHLYDNFCVKNIKYIAFFCDNAVHLVICVCWNLTHRWESNCMTAASDVWACNKSGK